MTSYATRFADINESIRYSVDRQANRLTRFTAQLDFANRLRRAHPDLASEWEEPIIEAGRIIQEGLKNQRVDLEDLVAQGEISQAVADAHPQLIMAGLVGSIDNDMFGTDMTIGADTALHRIVEAVDAISSTAASHSPIVAWPGLRMRRRPRKPKGFSSPPPCRVAP